MNFWTLNSLYEKAFTGCDIITYWLRVYSTFTLHIIAIYGPLQIQTHKAIKTQVRCRSHVSDFNDWHVDLPDLNVMDYAIWASWSRKLVLRGTKCWVPSAFLEKSLGRNCSEYSSGLTGCVSQASEGSNPGERGHIQWWLPNASCKDLNKFCWNSTGFILFSKRL